MRSLLLLFWLSLCPGLTLGQGMHSAPLGTSIELYEQEACGDVYGEAFPNWEVQERMRDFKLPTLPAVIWNQKGALSNRLNGRIPRQLYLADIQGKLSFRLAMGSYSSHSIFRRARNPQWPSFFDLIEGEEFANVFVDPYGWVFFGVFKGKDGWRVRTEELEGRPAFNRVLEFPKTFKPVSPFRQFGPSDVLVLGTAGSGADTVSELYQLDMTPVMRPDSSHAQELDNGLWRESDYGRLRLVARYKATFHSSFEYDPETQQLALIEDPGRESKLVIRKTEMTSNRKLQIQGTARKVQLPNLDQVEILSADWVAAIDSKRGIFYGVSEAKTVRLPATFVPNPRLGARSAYYHSRRRLVFLLARDGDRVRLAKYYLQSGKFEFLTPEGEDVLEFEMSAKGQVVYVARAPEASRTFSGQSLKLVDGDGKTWTLSQGKGPYTSVQSREELRQLADAYSPGSGSKSKSLDAENSLSNGFFLSPNGLKVIFSEFTPHFADKDPFRNSTRLWKGTSLLKKEEPVTLSRMHGFSWIFPSPDFFSAALVTYARPGTLQGNPSRRVSNDSRRLDADANHRIFFIGNPQDFGHSMGGYKRDWVSRY